MEQFEHAGLTIKLEPDEDRENPREWSNVGTMVCYHGRYNLGDKHQILDSKAYSGWDEVEEAIRAQYDVFGPVIPLRLYDHSGISISTSNRWPYNCPWDSGQVGFIFATADSVGENLVEGTTREQVRAMLEDEVRVYDQYLRGDVWCYDIQRGDEYLDSLGGIYSYDYALEQAKAAAEVLSKDDDRPTS